ncbi:hypothetical protein COLO4_02952, partial [Corchorus olitorius]
MTGGSRFTFLPFSGASTNTTYTPVRSHPGIPSTAQPQQRQGANQMHVNDLAETLGGFPERKIESDPKKMIEETTQKLWDRMEEKLKGLSGTQKYFKGVDKVSLVTDLVLPPK